MDMGNPLPLLAVVELGEVVLRGWKLRLCAFVKLRGAFVGIWKLERLVWMRKNLGLWCAWKLGGCFWGYIKTSGWSFWVHGNLASLHIRNFRCAFAVCVKLRGFCAFGGTSGAFGGGIVSFGGRLVVVLLFRFYGNSVAFVGHRNLGFRVCLHIPLGWWGAFGMGA